MSAVPFTNDVGPTLSPDGFPAAGEVGECCYLRVTKCSGGALTNFYMRAALAAGIAAFKYNGTCYHFGPSVECLPKGAIVLTPGQVQVFSSCETCAGYQRATNCNGTLSDLYMTAADATATPFFRYTGECYKFTGVTGTPGTLLTPIMVQPFASCAACLGLPCGNCTTTPVAYRFVVTGSGNCGCATFPANATEKMSSFDGSYDLVPTSACLYEGSRDNVSILNQWGAQTCDGPPVATRNIRMINTVRIILFNGVPTVEVSMFLLDMDFGNINHQPFNARRITPGDCTTTYLLNSLSCNSTERAAGGFTLRVIPIF